MQTLTQLLPPEIKAAIELPALHRSGELRGGQSRSKRIDGELPRLFSTLPRLTFTIKPFPREVAESAHAGVA